MRLYKQSFSGVSIHILTHTRSYRRESDDDRHTHIHTPISTLHCLHRHIFFLYVYRSISLARMQSAYLFHQYAKSLLSTDGRIADCTVRHPGVKRPFSSMTSRHRIFKNEDFVFNSYSFIREY